MHSLRIEATPDWLRPGSWQQQGEGVSHEFVPRMLEESIQFFLKRE